MREALVLCPVPAVSLAGLLRAQNRVLVAPHGEPADGRARARVQHPARPVDRGPRAQQLGAQGVEVCEQPGDDAEREGERVRFQGAKAYCPRHFLGTCCELAGTTHGASWQRG